MGTLRQLAASLDLVYTAILMLSSLLRQTLTVRKTLFLNCHCVDGDGHDCLMIVNDQNDLGEPDFLLSVELV